MRVRGLACINQGKGTKKRYHVQYVPTVIVLMEEWEDNDADQTQALELPAYHFILCRHGLAEVKRKEETDSPKDVLNDGAKLILRNYTLNNFI